MARVPVGASADSGEVVGRSPGMMTGDHMQPALTAAAPWFDAFITYRKGLKAWQRYRIRLTLAGADPSWNDTYFEFLREEGALCAAGYMNGVTTRLI